MTLAGKMVVPQANKYNEAVHCRTMHNDEIMIVVTIVMLFVVMVTMHLFMLMLSYADCAQ